MLEFLQERFSAGLALPTLKVYVAAISAYHNPLGGMSLGKDPLLSCFLRGTLMLRPAARTRVPVTLDAYAKVLDAYVHRAKNKQLFVCFGPPNKGSPASKQRMSKWVVEAISLAYESAGQPTPMAVRSHSTRSMAASKVLISGVALQEVCDAAGWSSPHIFIRFYSLDLDSIPGYQVLSS